MVRHIVMWTLKATAEGRSKSENARLIKQRLEALGHLPGVISLQVGINAFDDPDAADIVLFSEFDDWDALKAYHVHPEHVAVKPLVGACRISRQVTDYEC